MRNSFHNIVFGFLNFLVVSLLASATSFGVVMQPFIVVLEPS